MEQLTATHAQKLVEGLYSAANPTVAKEIQEQLQAVQRQQQAWEIASQLLSSPSDQCRFFGAHTFQVKIARDWNTLPEDRIDWLRNELLTWIIRSCTGPLFITTKLCLALITYAFHTVPTRWQDFIPDTVNAIHAGASSMGAPSQSVTTTILEFLTLVPEEVASTELISSRKPQIAQELKNSTSIVLSTLATVLNDTDISLQQKTLRALQSWIQYGVSLEEASPLLQQCMTLLGQEELFQSSADVLLEAMQQPSYGKYLSFRDALLQCFTSNGMRAKFAECITDENDEDGASIAKLLTGFGETYIDHVAEQLADPSIRMLLDMIMQLTGFPGTFCVDQEVSDIPLNFWFMLQETLFDNGIVPIRQPVAIVTNGVDDATTTTTAAHDNDPAQQAWLQQCGETAMMVYRQLVVVLKRQSTFPDDATWTSWPKDIKDKFRIYRRDLADTLINPYFVLRDEMLDIIMQDASSLLNRWGSASSLGQELEATLFCLKSISEEVPTDEATHIRHFFGPEILERFPEDADIRLQNTTLLTIGALAEWLKGHPQYLPAVMNYIVPCLSIPKLSPSAASAFSDICDTCRDSLTEELNSLMHVYSSMASSMIEPNIMQKVVESVADVIQVLPPENAMAPLMALTGDILQGVSKALSVTQQDPVAARDATLIQIKYLSACCRGIQSPDDYQSIAVRNSTYDMFANGQLVAMYANVEGFSEVTQAIHTSVQQIVTSWQQDEQVMKALSNFVECGIRATSPLLTLRFDDLIDMLNTCYNAAPFACWLHTAALVMTVYGGAEMNHARLRDLAGVLTQKTLSFIHKSEDMEHYPDVVDSYFDMLSATVRRCPMVFFHLPQDMINAILQFAIAGMCLQERLALKAALNFMADFFGREYEEGSQLAEFVQSLVMSWGMQIMEQLLTGIGGKVPRSFSRPLVDVLYKLMGRYVEASRHWLQTLLAHDGFPSALVQPKDKEEFLKGIIGTRSIKRFRDCTNEFLVKCRGLNNTAYGSIA